MRLKKPTRAIIDQVRITREGNDAIIDYADAGIAGTRLTIGPDIATMTDRDIIDVRRSPAFPRRRRICRFRESGWWWTQSRGTRLRVQIPC
jgi:hypothetical protein